jgi:cytochrome c oxidase subunit III
LGTTFLFCQAYEYTYGVKFSWRDSIYGSIFFMSTGFHGFHVTIGTIFLLFCWARHFTTTTLVEWALDKKNVVVTTIYKLIGYQPALSGKWAFVAEHHFGFEAAAWYWHFVDVVWLFLFLTVYCWGGK